MEEWEEEGCLVDRKLTQDKPSEPLDARCRSTSCYLQAGHRGGHTNGWVVWEEKNDVSSEPLDAKIARAFSKATTGVPSRASARKFA